jgi:inorganic pyrophosphatase
MNNIICTIEMQTGSNQKMLARYDKALITACDYVETGVNLKLERVFSSNMKCPGNYGCTKYSNKYTGKPVYTLMPVDYTIPIGCKVKCRIIGTFIVKSEEDKYNNITLIVMPENDVDARFAHITHYNDLSTNTLDEIKSFFQQYIEVTQNKKITIEFIDIKDIEQHVKLY